MKYIKAKTNQENDTEITCKTRLQSFAQFVYRRYNKTLNEFVHIMVMLPECILDSSSS